MDDFDFGDNTDFMTVAELMTEVGWPLDYTATRYLVPYIKRLRGNLKGIEIGTARGEGAYLILESCPNVAQLVTVDPYKEYFDWNGLIAQETLDKYKEIAKQNLPQRWGARVAMKETIPVDTYDFAFVDGDHAMNKVLEDLEKISPMVKTGGLIAVHDTNLPDVVAAMKAFRKAHKINTPIHNIPNNVAFWYQS